MKNQSPQQAFQSAWVVDNIEAAAQQWVETTGIGPFFIADYQQGVLTDTFYRGTPTAITMKTALAQAGDIQIELIEPTGTQPNIYRDTVAAGKPGFHHICLWTHNLQQSIDTYTQQGFEVAAQGKVGSGVSFAYVDTSPALGHMTELLQYAEEIEAVFDRIAQAAKNWDGSNPIRGYD